MRNPEETLLYRGDAAEISEFDVFRTDKWALFSRGIYLTDCPKIANDYTVKGGGDTVFVAKRANSVRDLVSEYLHHIMVKELGFEALAQKLHQEWSRRVTSENCKEMERGLTLERIILIRRLMPKAKKLFAERRSSLRVFLDTTGQWTLVASATPASSRPSTFQMR